MARHARPVEDPGWDRTSKIGLAVLAVSTVLAVAALVAFALLCMVLK